MEYRVLKTLGAGNFSKTELAKTPDDHLIVVKSFTTIKSQQWKELELFQREVVVLKQLDHPALPRFYGVDDGEEGVKLAYHYIEGSNLIELLQEGPLFQSEGAAIWLLREIAEILHYLHAFHPPVIHRDLKPANIIVDPDGKIYLIDFGATISTLSGRGGGTTIIGTSGYMPPEQLQGLARPASDLYALGATMIYLITGIPPENLLTDQFRFDYKQYATIHLSRTFISILDQLTDPYLETRFQSAWELLGAIERLQPSKISVQKRFTVNHDTVVYRGTEQGEDYYRTGEVYRFEPVESINIAVGDSVKLLSFEISGGFINIKYRGEVYWIPLERSWYRYCSETEIISEITPPESLLTLKSDQILWTKSGEQMVLIPKETRFRFEQGVGLKELGFDHDDRVPVTIYSGKCAGATGYFSAFEENYQTLLDITPVEQVALWGGKVPVKIAIYCFIIYILYSFFSWTF